jgi:hypothetical protein
MSLREVDVGAVVCTLPSEYCMLVVAIVPVVILLDPVSVTASIDRRPDVGVSCDQYVVHRHLSTRYNCSRPWH